MTKSDIYFYSWEQLVDKEIREALCEALDTHGDSADVAAALGWDQVAVERLLEQRPLANLLGDPVFLLTQEDLHRHSLKQVTVLIKCAVVQILAEELGSQKVNRAIGRFINKDNRYVGWLRAQGKQS